ncbi:class II aldolase/adducin family protein [Saccharopolyspora thermophila]|uniref:class II aldolase/adducin family protein n=1 Tax=Saccharopolyspora thermophila TaxID=89367 RepID=UPI001667E4E9|nr:class II aldolase/adducin family protein [Saccharopolyspora subtropica]
MDARLAEQRREVIRIARRMVADRLVVGTSGNVSVRCGDLVAVTPSGVDYEDLRVPDIPLVDLDGNVVEGDLKPTSELPMHLTAYREHDAGAVVHTHSLNATALSLLRDDVPAVHYQLADFGGAVRVARYATFGSPELAESMSQALAGRTGCVLRNHGTITIAETLPKAYHRARQLEWLCELWLTAARVGDPHLLSDEELARCAKLFATYGQNPRN